MKFEFRKICNARLYNHKKIETNQLRFEPRTLHFVLNPPTSEIKFTGSNPGKYIFLILKTQIHI